MKLTMVRLGPPGPRETLKPEACLTIELHEDGGLYTCRVDFTHASQHAKDNLGRHVKAKSVTYNKFKNTWFGGGILLFMQPPKNVDLNSHFTRTLSLLPTANTPMFQEDFDKVFEKLEFDNDFVHTPPNPQPPRNKYMCNFRRTQRRL